MNTLLVTGGAGFIGSNFSRYWLKQFPNDLVIVLDKLTYAGQLTSLKDLEQLPNFTFFRGDIADEHLLSQIFQQYQVTKVVNFAAETHVDRSIQDADAFVHTNIVGTHRLLKVAKYFWLEDTRYQSIRSFHQFHHISTDEVYGSLAVDESAFTENSPFNPNSPYAASKAAADHLVWAFHVTYGLRTTVSHCSNNYGPYHFPEKLIPLALLRILHGEWVPVYGDGLQVRDWLHVHDHCRALGAILQQGQAGERYNIGGYQGEITNLNLIHTLVSLVCEIFESEPERKQQYPKAMLSRTAQAIQHVTDRLGHDRRYAINSKKLMQTLKFNYTINLAQGLRETVLWYLDNKAWWEHLYGVQEQRIETIDTLLPASV